MRRAAAILMLLPTLALGEEPRAFDCVPQAESEPAFGVLLWQESAFGVPVHCIEGLDLRGLAACAPQGGWGLSDPGEGRLRAVATRPQEALGEGGKVFARVGPSEFVASASVGYGLPLALEVQGETFWRLRMALASGEGAWFGPGREVRFRCVERAGD